MVVLRHDRQRSEPRFVCRQIPALSISRAVPIDRPRRFFAQALCDCRSAAGLFGRDFISRCRSRGAADCFSRNHRSIDSTVCGRSIPRIYAFPIRNGFPLVGRSAQSAGRRRVSIFRLSINAVGAVATGMALAIILAAKFIEGLDHGSGVPILLTLFRAVHHHYRKLARDRPRRPLDLSNNEEPVALVPTKKWDLLTSKSLRFGMWLSPDLIAVHVTNQIGDKAAAEKKQLTIQWDKEVQEPARAGGSGATASGGSIALSRRGSSRAGPDRRA